MHNLLAALLGLIEGLTEFIPVSSTAHLLLAAKILHFESAADAFEVLIQLGAILAVIVLYFSRLWTVVVTLPSSPHSRQFALSVLIAFIPAIVLGLGLHHFIKALFDRIDVICYALIVGGILLWLVDKYAPEPVHHDATKLDLKTSIAIGFFQCLAMIPGMSRSGSTLIGALLFKVDKRAAAEFSFFLAIPTMIGAFALDFIKSYKLMSPDDYTVIAIGFVVAFLSALLVIKPFLAFVSKRGYGIFAAWRVLVGVGGLLLLHFTKLLG